MMTLRFESEDFNVRDLLAALEQTSIPDGISVSIKASIEAKSDKYQVSADRKKSNTSPTKPEKKEDERPVFSDTLEVISKMDVTEEAIKLVFNSVLIYAFVKIKEMAFAEPHIVIRFNNGAKRKIIYDKGNSAIAEEILSYVKKGDVTSIEFKS